MRPDEALTAKLAALLPHLDERQRRLVLGAEARALGHGGISMVARAAGASMATVSRGMTELAQGGKPLDRARRPGGGRKPISAVRPDLLATLLSLLEPADGGDADPSLRWTTKATRQLARELTDAGYPVSAPTVGKMLRAEGFTLSGRLADSVGTADRGAQFRHVLDRAREHHGTGDAVLSVGMRKKDLARRPAGDSAGWADAGCGDDIAHVAVAGIRSWWLHAGQAAYPGTERMLIVVTGGRDGARARVWKDELARFADDTGLRLAISHLPPGTSKWNSVEHRAVTRFYLDSARGLTCHEVSVQTVPGARAPRADAEPRGERAADGAPSGSAFDGEWNYVIAPTASTVSTSY